MKFLSKSAEETRIFAKKIASKLSGGEVLCLYGDLGAGKTTFVSGVVNFFLPRRRVVSPTFIIVRHYVVSHFLIKNFYHIDLYRITKEDEIHSMMAFDYMRNSDSVLAVEWAEKLGSLLPRERIDIEFKTICKDHRLITVNEK